MASDRGIFHTKIKQEKFFSALEQGTAYFASN